MNNKQKNLVSNNGGSMGNCELKKQEVEIIIDEKGHYYLKEEYKKLLLKN